ncbi:hypothetical protein DB346_08125 [Verrucomicrobia bacterium LW23]|nr:hypothetical protein DB346_08125 [Verrucomicrobia bacterium LW23]
MAVVAGVEGVSFMLLQTVSTAAARIHPAFVFYFLLSKSLGILGRHICDAISFGTFKRHMIYHAQLFECSPERLLLQA